MSSQHHHSSVVKSYQPNWSKIHDSSLYAMILGAILLPVASTEKASEKYKPALVILGYVLIVYGGLLTPISKFHLKPKHEKGKTTSNEKTFLAFSIVGALLVAVGLLPFVKQGMLGGLGKHAPAALLLGGLLWFIPFIVHSWSKN